MNDYTKLIDLTLRGELAHGRVDIFSSLINKIIDYYPQESLISLVVDYFYNRAVPYLKPKEFEHLLEVILPRPLTQLKGLLQDERLSRSWVNMLKRLNLWM